MTDNLKRFLIQQLRRISWKWPAFGEAKRRARVDRGQYLCAACGNIYRAKEVHLDHIDPVIALTGYVSLDIYCERLFCGVENLQVLCLNCHDKKTKAENAGRV